MYRGVKKFYYEAFKMHLFDEYNDFSSENYDPIIHKYCYDENGKEKIQRNFIIKAYNDFLYIKEGLYEIKDVLSKLNIVNEGIVSYTKLNSEYSTIEPLFNSIMLTDVKSSNIDFDYVQNNNDKCKELFILLCDMIEAGALTFSINNFSKDGENIPNDNNCFLVLANTYFPVSFYTNRNENRDKTTEKIQWIDFIEFYNVLKAVFANNDPVTALMFRTIDDKLFSALSYQCEQNMKLKNFSEYIKFQIKDCYYDIISKKFATITKADK